MTQIAAANGFSGAGFNLQNAQNVSLQRLEIRFDGGVEQTSVSGGTSSTCYDAVSLDLNSTLSLEDLPANSTVEIVHLIGHLLVSDSSQATILAHFMNCVDGGGIPGVEVDGTSPKNGLLGFLTLNGCPVTEPILDVENNQDAVATDFYFEQGQNEVVHIAGEGEAAGNVTAAFAKADVFLDVMPNTTEVEVDNYQGRLSLFDGYWEQDLSTGGMTHGGQLLQTGTAPVWLTVWGQAETPLLLNAAGSASICSTQNLGRTPTVQMDGLAEISAGLEDSGPGGTSGAHPGRIWHGCTDTV